VTLPRCLIVLLGWPISQVFVGQRHAPAQVTLSLTRADGRLVIWGLWAIWHLARASGQPRSSAAGGVQVQGWSWNVSQCNDSSGKWHAI
jgi:hypothetical protein